MEQTQFGRQMSVFGCHRWTMTLQPEGQGTRLTQRMERVYGPLWLRLLQPILLWPTVERKSVRKGLATIKSRLETRMQLGEP